MYFVSDEFTVLNKKKNSGYSPYGNQKPMSTSLPVHFILESTFARVFLFLDWITLKQDTHICINLHTLFVLILSSFDKEGNSFEIVLLSNFF